jgi:polar amino acid transport system substrate-binding protein
MNKKYTGQLLLSLSLVSLPHLSIAQTIKMGFGESLRPYVIKETHEGVELDIIRAALAYKNHHLIPVYAPLHSLPILFNKKRVDAINVKLQANLKRTYFETQPTLFYQDIILSLEKNDYTITKPDDLKKLRVFAFKNAHLYYPKWLMSLKNTANYQESSLQFSQVSLLHLQRVDAIIADKNIIQYYTHRLKKEGKVALQPTQIHSPD